MPGHGVAFLADITLFVSVRLGQMALGVSGHLARDKSLPSVLQW